jgi:hypothetical protein
MKAKQFKISLLALTILLTGCASYNSQPLANAIFETADSKQDVVAMAKTFDKADCKRYLDRDVIAEGYQPVQLYIQNNSDKNYIFSLNRMTIPYARAEEVADKVHTSTVGRAVGYGVAALFIWPFAIPAVVDGVKSAQANDNLDIDFSAKTARDQTIAPHSYFNKIVFVPQAEYQSTFSLTLIDQESKEPKTLEVSAN